MTIERIGFLFPGQGAQYAGMGKDLYENSEVARSLFEKADRVLNFKLSKLCFEGPQDILKKTDICQPAIFTVSIAAMETLKELKDLRPDFLAGLSLGEYSALCAAGALDFADALILLRKRGQLMQEAAEECPGEMISIIGVSRENVAEIAKQADAEVANLNCPGQIIVSGSSQNIERARQLAQEAGARKIIALDVAGAFHSKFMKNAGLKLEKELERVDIKMPQAQVVSNVDARPYKTVAQIKKYLTQQISSSVLWQDSCEFMLKEGVNKFYEIGPGKVLKGLMGRINANVPVINIDKYEDITKLLNC